MLVVVLGSVLSPVLIALSHSLILPEAAPPGYGIGRVRLGTAIVSFPSAINHRHPINHSEALGVGCWPVHSLESPKIESKAYGLGGSIHVRGRQLSDYGPNLPLGHRLDVVAIDSTVTVHAVML